METLQQAAMSAEELASLEERGKILFAEDNSKITSSAQPLSNNSLSISTAKKKGSTKKSSKKDFKKSPRHVSPSTRVPAYRSPDDKLHSSRDTLAVSRGDANTSSPINSSSHVSSGSKRTFQSEHMVADMLPSMSERGSLDLSTRAGGGGAVNESRPGAYRVAGDTGSTCTVRRPLGRPIRQETGITTAGVNTTGAGVVPMPTPGSGRSVSLDLSLGGVSDCPPLPSQLDVGANQDPVSAISIVTNEDAHTSNVEAAPSHAEAKKDVLVSPPWYRTRKFQVCALVMLLVCAAVVGAVVLAVSGGKDHGSSEGDDSSHEDQRLRDMILTITSEQDLNDKNSVQFWAFNWLKEDWYDLREEHNVLHRYALVVLFYSTGRQHMLIPGEDECNWEGVDCKDDHVWQILLLKHQGDGQNRNNGSIPLELSYLTTLEKLKLKYSAITDFSIDVFQMLPNLNTIDFSWNDINVPIPESLYNWTSLEILI